MSIQVNVRLPTKLHDKAMQYAEEQGYSSLQELMKEALREQIDDEFSPEEIEVIKKAADVILARNDFGTREELYKSLHRKQ